MKTVSVCSCRACVLVMRDGQSSKHKSTIEVNSHPSRSEGDVMERGWGVHPRPREMLPQCFLRPSPPVVRG